MTRFQPDTGKIEVYRSAGGNGVRLDGGNGFAGAVITPFYDSMLTKCTCHGSTFEVARRKASLEQHAPVLLCSAMFSYDCHMFPYASLCYAMLSLFLLMLILGFPCCATMLCCVRTGRLTRIL
jgi:hypothetical protein